MFRAGVVRFGYMDGNQENGGEGLWFGYKYQGIVRFGARPGVHYYRT